MGIKAAKEDSSDEFVLVDMPGIREADQVSLETQEKITVWLSPTDYNSDSGDLRKHLQARNPGTCKWVQDRHEFQELQSSSTNKGLLWLEGIPGSGKSVIASAFIDDLSNDGAVPVLFFFFRRAIEANLAPRSLLRDWMSQLVPYSSDLARKLENEMRRHASVTMMSFDILWRTFTSSILEIPKVYCIVDALDEMEPGNDWFLEKLSELAQLKPSAVQVVATSRQSPALDSIFTKDHVAKIKLNHQNVDSDIAVFVHNRLQAFGCLRSDEGSLKNIEAAICRISNGLFLYARLILDKILEKGHLQGAGEILESVVSKMPKGIEELYSTLLKEQRNRLGVSIEQQSFILQWVTHATRPLRLIELANILQISKGESAVQAAQAEAKSQVRQACGPLLQILADGTVQVIHHSFAEFITDETERGISLDEDSAFPIIKAARTHRMMTLACLTYLSFSFFLDPWDPNEPPEDMRDEYFYSKFGDTTTVIAWRERSRKYPYLEYAANNWATHAKACTESTEIDTELLEALDHFLVHEKRLFQSWSTFFWLPRHQWHESKIPDFGPLHVAAYFGITQYAKNLLESHTSPASAETSCGRTPLSLAAEKGHLSTVSLLLQYSDLNTHCRDGLTPLDYAAKSGHDSTVRQLLESGMRSTTARCIHGDKCSVSWGKFKDRRAYRCAIYHGNTQVIRELLNYRGPDDHGPNKRGSTLLHWAAKYGRADIASVLIDTGLICIDAKDENGHTPLFKAATNGDAAVMRTLLAYGADSNLLFVPKLKYSESSLKPKTTLLHVCALRQLAVQGEENKSNAVEGELVALEFIYAGIDANAQDAIGQTPLHHAARCFWRSQMASLLLQHGACPSITDHEGNTPLHCVASAEMVHTIVSAGADPNARKIDDKTPLVAYLSTTGWYNGSVEIVAALLKNGANVDHQDQAGNSALMVSMMKHPEAIFNVLLEYGADLKVRNRKSEGILHVLYERIFLMKSEPFLKILQERRVDIDARDHQGRTALFCCAVDGQSDKALALLDAGANVGIPDYRGRSVLHAVVGSPLGKWPEVNQFHSCKAKIKIMKRILEVGFDGPSHDCEGNTALMELAKADWTTSDHPLDERANEARLQAIEILLSANVSPASKNVEGKTCLHLAAFNVDRQMKYRDSRLAIGTDKMPLHKFLGLGIDVNDADNSGNTPLHMAASIPRDEEHLAEYHVWKLLDAGADSALRNTDQMTPLHLAAKAGQCSSVAILTEAMKSRSLAVHNRDALGKTSLHYASSAGKLDSVRTLVKAGADCNIRDYEGRTPLHDVAHKSPDQSWERQPCKIHQTREIIKLLMLSGANVDMKDTRGLTPVDVAVESGSGDALEELFTLSKMHNIAEWIHSRYGGQQSFTSYFRGLSAAEKSQISARTIQKLAKDPKDNASALASLFCEVVRKGDAAAVDELLRLGVDVFKSPPNKYDSLEYGPPFHLMGLGGHDQMMRKVVSPEAVKRLGDMDQTALHYAAHSQVNNLEMIKLLVNQGIDINARARHPPEQDYDSMTVLGPTALHYLSHSTYHWQNEALEHLISRGGDIHMENGFGCNCLQIAVQQGGFWKYRTVAMLLRNGADVNALYQEGHTALYSATRRGDLPMVKLLIEHGANLDIGDEPPILTAVDRQIVAIVDLLLRKGATVSFRPKSTSLYGYHRYTSLLQLACRSDGCYTTEESFVALSILKLLLKNGANVNEADDNGFALIHYLAKYNGLLDPIIKAGADIERLDPDGRTPLLVACASNRSSSLPWAFQFPHTALVLLEAGANASATDKLGRNALHLLLSKVFQHYERRAQSEAVIHALLAAGCSCSAPDNDGWIPLHYALSNGKFSRAAILVQAGADINLPDPDGNNALHHVMRFMSRYPFRRERDYEENPLPYLPLWREAGVDINGANKVGASPIFYAAETHFDENSLQLYLDAGADVTMRNNDGEGLLHVIAKGARYVCRNNCFDRCQCFDDDGQFEAKKFELLVQHEKCRLDPRMEDNMQKTPLDLAAASGYTEILRLFVEK